MDATMFTHDSPGRLTQVGTGASRYTAYRPDPLPPRIQLDAETTLLLSQADQSLGRLAGIAHFVNHATLLVKPLLRREAVLSSHIEGTQSGLDDLYRYEAGRLPFPPSPGTPDNEDAHEVYNCVLALEYGLHRLDSLPVSTRLIRELHRHLMKGVCGDQSLYNGQNWTLASSPKTHVKIYLFAAVDKNQYRFEGQVELAAQPYQEQQHDEAGMQRLVWVFPLQRVS
jgi:Fic family protein